MQDSKQHNSNLLNQFYLSIYLFIHHTSSVNPPREQCLEKSLAVNKYINGSYLGVLDVMGVFHLYTFLHVLSFL